MLRFSTIIKSEVQTTRKCYASSFVLRKRIFTLCRNNDVMATVRNADVTSLRDVHYAANILRGSSPFTVGKRNGSTVLNHAAFVSKLDGKEEKPGLLQVNSSGKFRHFPNTVLSRNPHRKLTYRFNRMRKNIEVNAVADNKTHWLTFKDGKLSFEPSSDPDYHSLFSLYLYTVTTLSNYTPIVLVSQNQSRRELCMPLAVDATRNNDIVMSPFSGAYFMGDDYSPDGCGQFLKLVPSEFGDQFFYIQSSQTGSYISIANITANQLAPIMSNRPLIIRINEIVPWQNGIPRF